LLRYLATAVVVTAATAAVRSTKAVAATAANEDKD